MVLGVLQWLEHNYNDVLCVTSSDAVPRRSCAARPLPLPRCQGRWPWRCCRGVLLPSLPSASSSPSRWDYRWAQTGDILITLSPSLTQYFQRCSKSIFKSSFSFEEISTKYCKCNIKHSSSKTAMSYCSTNRNTLIYQHYILFMV